MARIDYPLPSFSIFPALFSRQGSVILRSMLQRWLPFFFPAALFVLLAVVVGCKKYTDTPGQSDPRLTRKYCNDPEAVNFNRDFPGTEDNSVCIYPANAFQGTYDFIDSVYSGNNVLQKELPLTLQITAQSHTKMTITGLCGASQSTGIAFTAARTLRATVDTTIVTGQPLCRIKDTVSGYIAGNTSDGSRIRFYLSVVSDTGTTQHMGTAYRR